MKARSLSLEALPGRVVIARAERDAPLPEALTASAQPGFLVLMRGLRSCTIVCAEERSSELAGFRVDDTRWRVLRLAGDFDFEQSGVLAPLADALAKASIPLLVYAAFETDYLLVKDADFESACAALSPRVSGV